MVIPSNSIVEYPWENPWENPLGPGIVVGVNMVVGLIPDNLLSILVVEQGE